MTNRDVLAELLILCAKGDQRSYETLYRMVSPKLYAIGLALLRNEEMAEDVLQDSFVKIWNRAMSYDPARGSAMTWMTSIVRNRALDLLRSSRLQMEQKSENLADLDLVTTEHGPSAASEIHASTAAIMACLDQLKDQQKHCILMAYYYGYTHCELAASLQTPLGTIKAWIRRGLEQVRECLN
jgi:RNA polymerase sigma-70 factor (ECF subfamily)